MTEVQTPPQGETPTPPKSEATDDQRVPYERFDQVNKKAKDAAEKASAAEKRAAELQRQLEEREAAGLPELEQLRKRLEQAEKRASEAESAKTESDRAVRLGKAERLILAAAKDFHDPDDAVRNVNLDDIESADDAERAVKRVAKQKAHLLKGDEKPLPGKILDHGRAIDPARKQGDPLRATDEEAAKGMLEEINRVRQSSGARQAGGLL